MYPARDIAGWDGCVCASLHGRYRYSQRHLQDLSLQVTQQISGKAGNILETFLGLEPHVSILNLSVCSLLFRPFFWVLVTVTRVNK